jgi:glutathione S-transferase
VSFGLTFILGEHKKNEEFLKVNSAGLVPAIQDGDFTLAEGGAILGYIADKEKLQNWYPTELKHRAIVNKWLHWHHGALRRSTTKILVPALTKTEVNTQELRQFKKDLQYLNSQLQNSTYLAGSEHPTIADLMVIPEIDQLTDEGFALFDYTPYPNIVRYMNSVKSNVSSYDEVFAPLANQKVIPRKNSTA